MKKRKILPDVEELNCRFNFDFDKGLIYNKLTGKVLASSHQSGYQTVCFRKGIYYYSHRVLWKAFYKEEPPQIIDHINNVKNDNRIVNLKAVTRHENKVKSPKVYNLSGFRGVVKRKDRNKFEVKVSCDALLRDKLGVKELSIGYYDNEYEAAAAYNIALTILGLDLNFKNKVDFDESLVDTTKSFFIKFGGGLSHV